MGYSGYQRMDAQERDYIQHLFGKHISRGQVRYLRCAHLDIYERSRRGCTMVDAVSGKKFFDCFSSAGCFNVGRGNPKIQEALEKALDSWDMGSHLALSEPKIRFAEKLASLCPGDLKKVVLCTTGADACAAAIKLAKGATGRNDVITMNKAYHGHEGFSLSANGKDYYKELFLPLMPGFHIAEFNDLEAVKRIASKDIAAVVLEPVQGEGGIHVATREYMTGLRRLCDELGIMLIFDEVQTGFGRTGKMWCMEHYGIVPDIMFTSKSISGGVYPNGAVVYRDIEPLTSYVEKNPLFHTSHSGGTDLGCIVSSAVLDYLAENKVWEHAAEIGGRFKEGLIEIWNENRHAIKEVRGLGLMIGIEYKYEFLGALMADCLAKQGVWAVYSGNAPQVMRFQIPITATMEEVEELLGRIRAAVKAMKIYLALFLPLAKVPLFRMILDNLKVQIISFNIVRDLEELLFKYVLKR
ncbi:MAG: Putrescine aminotransferase [Deltaproteobacteria bacterium ADurb.BinA179]|nr:MAG: Putrescine aminotransferase [Deltaproteobacteria bacterium ADurb.BinA179]HNU73334.1 aminotransferase class III-fold pyridoxal phosphate-dependent enzyme [Deltaproteobacteria bacterium]HON62244.1 aminotransferase class III-fold pyridoxal phosphate-dependent enzyme [Deltaproteobacteria bacterium]HQQ16601.1 aminotransferase class III-fold pyridoxal phosphate-dependent enzyme [Deltaproteobacteria bacterium]